jgi:TPR repeat protein
VGPTQLDQARSWWEKAADAETTSAMYNLSLLQANRWDPPQLDQARTWYEKAADGGNTNAMYNLGMVTNQWDPPQGGPGPPPGTKKAMGDTQRSADIGGGHVPASVVTDVRHHEASQAGARLSGTGWPTAQRSCRSPTR